VLGFNAAMLSFYSAIETPEIGWAWLLQDE
jgi:hypothetical protein